MYQFNGFACEASGTNLQFFWRHNDQLIDAKYPLKFPRFEDSNLQPNKDFLTEDYDGTYQCFAKNSIGTVFGRKATVKFTSKVVFTFYSQSGLEITAKMRSCWVILLPCQLFSQVTLSLIQKNKLIAKEQTYHWLHVRTDELIRTLPAPFVLTRYQEKNLNRGSPSLYEVIFASDWLIFVT